MEFNPQQFLSTEHKRITLLGMSGVGKTRLASILRKSDWFHYSADYRIGTHYLDEAILDNIKIQAMQVPFLRDLLQSDSIYICNNITVDHLKPVASFMGKLGNPEQDGLSLNEFKRRQHLHRDAEIAAMNDVPTFIQKAQDIYGYKHFINDAGGSACELDDPTVIETLARHTLILYIQASKQDEKKLIQRAENDPKPLYYRETFLDEQLEIYMSENNLPYIALINPDEFVRWVFPRLFHSRIPRYEAIAKEYGYTISTDELAKVQTENDFINLIATAIARKNNSIK
ncbi:MAG: Nif11-like leader peptide family natural product precursor [Gammaproteobacteria bacterium]|nr:Nif11-like leader peptide family natural product precursor [Gammaproteobacteria bacterium]MCF6260247.1 Nif11-like leader peptide family natural product precursor [Gammaproteobacteria bacterium]